MSERAEWFTASEAVADPVDVPVLFDSRVRGGADVGETLALSGHTSLDELDRSMLLDRRPR